MRTSIPSGFGNGRRVPPARFPPSARRPIFVRSFPDSSSITTRPCYTAGSRNMNPRCLSASRSSCVPDAGTSWADGTSNRTATCPRENPSFAKSSLAAGSSPSISESSPARRSTSTRSDTAAVLCRSWRAVDLIPTFSPVLPVVPATRKNRCSHGSASTVHASPRCAARAMALRWVRRGKPSKTRSSPGAAQVRSPCSGEWEIMAAVLRERTCAISPKNLPRRTVPDSATRPRSNFSTTSARATRTCRNIMPGSTLSWLAVIRPRSASNKSTAVWKMAC